MLNKLRYQARQSDYLISIVLWIHILNDKQCRSRSVGFFRSQLIWIYTDCKGSVLSSAGHWLMRIVNIVSVGLALQIRPNKCFSYFFKKTCCGYSLEVSLRHTSNEYYNLFLRRNKKNISIFGCKKCLLWNYVGLNESVRFSYYKLLYN